MQLRKRLISFWAVLTGVLYVRHGGHCPALLGTGKLSWNVQFWVLHFQKDVDKMESFQRRATKMLKGLENLPCEKGFKMGIFSLEKRRLSRDLITRDPRNPFAAEKCSICFFTENL